MSWAVALFVSLLGFHVVYSVINGRKPAPAASVFGSITTLVASLPPFILLCCSGIKRIRVRMLLGAYLQVALFLLACWFGVQYGIFSRRLISPVHVAAGLLAGHLIFGVSLVATQQSWRAAAEHFIDFGALWRFVIDHPNVLLQFISVSIAEEMAYRVAAQPLAIEWAGSAVAGVLLVAVAFSFVHEHFFKNPVLQSAEFLGFAILLGALYYWTGSLILVIVIHAMRNIEIAFLEFLIRIDEDGSEDLAARETEFLAGQRLLVFLVNPVRGSDVACLEYGGDSLRPTLSPVVSMPGPCDAGRRAECV